MSETIYNIAMIGAGPASLYATDVLSKAGHHVTIINRDIKPGGLVEYGIYLNKYKMKSGLRKVFSRILRRDNVHYFGNVTIGSEGKLTLEDLRELGFDAIVVAVGAQGTKWLGLEGEQGPQVYHAKDVVYHYNALPPYSEQDFPVGDSVTVVGFGNVCLDIVHWLVCEVKVAEATIVARRGPNERASTPKELKLVSAALDLAQIRTEITETIADNLQSLGQDPQAAFEDITSFKDVPLETDSPTKLKMRFLLSPSSIERDEQGQVTGLRCEITQMTPPKQEGGRPGVKGTGEFEVLPCDAVVFAIGDSIEPSIGLPLEPKWKSTFATVPYAWDGAPDADRYMVFDPERETPIWDTFVVGWARKASDGLVGKARKDAVTGCQEVLAYLDHQFEQGPGQPADAALVQEKLRALFDQHGVAAVDIAGIDIIEAKEQALAKEANLPEFKFKSNQAMLDLLG